MTKTKYGNRDYFGVSLSGRLSCKAAGITSYQGIYLLPLENRLI